MEQGSKKPIPSAIIPVECLCESLIQRCLNNGGQKQGGGDASDATNHEVSFGWVAILASSAGSGMRRVIVYQRLYTASRRAGVVLTRGAIAITWLPQQGGADQLA